MDLPINKIICGDCLKVVKDWPDNCVDLVLTDPPYNKKIKYENYQDDLTTKQYNKFIYKYLSLVLEKSSGKIVLVVGSMLLWSWWQYLKEAKVISVKIGAVTYNREKNMRLQWCPVLTTVSSNKLVYDLWENIRWTFEGYYYKEKRYDHPAQTPLKLMLQCVDLFSTVGGLIVDTFCGSGTACVSAKMLGRRYIGIDTSKKSCEITRKRLKGVRPNIFEKSKKKKRIEIASFGLSIKKNKRRLK